MYNPWSTSEGSKEAIRNLLVEEAKKLSGVDRIYTLPSTEGLCALKFHDAFPHAAIVGSERDLSAFSTIVNEPKLSFINIRHESLKQHFSSEAQFAAYDVMFFDFCGYLTEEVLDTINLAVHNGNAIRRNDEFLLGITLSKTIRNPDLKEEMFETIKYRGFNIDSLSLDTTSEIIESFLVQPKDENSAMLSSVDIIHKIEYASKDTTVPMYFILFKCRT